MLYSIQNRYGEEIKLMSKLLYVSFDLRDGSKYLTSNSKKALGISTIDGVWLIDDPKLKELQDKIPGKENYEYCRIVEISADQIALNTMDNVKTIEKHIDLQDQNSLIIMTAIADLYEQISTLQGVDQNG